MTSSETCAFEKELPLLLYQGELTREERERLETHRATCARCGAAFAEMEAMAQALDAAPIAMPHADRWQDLKASVLARVSAESKSVSEMGQVSDIQPAAPGSCAEFEEDLLVLNEVGRSRRDEVLAHVATCATCRESRDAFGVLGIVLNRDRVTWPDVERWDALRANVIAAVDPDTAKKPKKPAKDEAEAAPKKKASARTPVPSAAVVSVPARTGWGTYVLRAAVVLVAFGVGAFASPWFRGASPDDIREFRRDAEGSPSLAIAIRSYERVVREGIGRPECQGDVEDALTQLPALRKCERALATVRLDDKRVELMNVIAQYPQTRAAEFALREYLPTLQNEPSPVRPADQNAPMFAAQNEPIRKSGFGPDEEPPFRVEPGRVHRMTDTLESQYASLDQIRDDELRSAEQRRLRPALAAAHLQKALYAPETAMADYDRVLQLYKDDATSPAALEARRGKEKLGHR